MKVPSWSVTGVVSEVRDLKTKEGKVWAYAVIVAALGGTYELMTRDEKQSKSVGAGEVVEATGGFRSFNGKVTFELVNIAKAKA